MPAPTATDVVPVDADLPGDGWLAVDEGFGGDGTSGAVAELFDCVGPTFPDVDVVATAASAHFVHLPRRLLHGIGVAFATSESADIAEEIFHDRDFAECLGASVAADLDTQPVDAELLGIDVSATTSGHRVSFTGGDALGVRPVHLDIVVVRLGDAIGLLWFGDTPEPFGETERSHVIERIRSRTDATT